MTEQVVRQQIDIPVLRDALLAAASAMAFDSRDWSLDRTDALLYALLCGWGAGDEAAWLEIAARHGWPTEYLSSMCRRRDAVAKFTREKS